MRLRMAKLSLEVSNGRAELAAEEALIEMRLYGAKSQLRRLATNFGAFATSWILNLWCAISQPCPDLSNGDFDLKVPYVTPDGIFDLTGYESLEEWRDNVLFGGNSGKQWAAPGRVGRSSPTWAPPRGTHSQVVQRHALLSDVMLITDTRQTKVPHLIRTY